MTTYSRVLCIGSIALPWTKKLASIFLKMEINAKDNGENARFTISGVIGPKANGDAAGSCGQIHDEILAAVAHDSITYRKGWSKALVLELLGLWDEWHLNDMHAGCEHQRALGWEEEGYDTHPSEPCPTCGYHFGSEWKRVELPYDFARKLDTFPKADSTPAWV